MGTLDGQTCKERRLDRHEYPMAVQLLWPKISSLPTASGDDNTLLTEYRYDLHSNSEEIPLLRDQKPFPIQQSFTSVFVQKSLLQFRCASTQCEGSRRKVRHRRVDNRLVPCKIPATTERQRIPRFMHASRAHRANTTRQFKGSIQFWPHLHIHWTDFGKPNFRSQF